MDTHIKVIALLHIIAGIFGCLIGLFFLLLFSGVATFLMIGVNEILPAGIVGLVGFILAGLMILASVPGVIGGIGLLKNAEWARLLIIIVSIFYIPLWIPIGTMIGVYSLFVLFNPEIQSLSSFNTSQNQSYSPPSGKL